MTIKPKMHKHTSVLYLFLLENDLWEVEMSWLLIAYFYHQFSLRNNSLRCILGSVMFKSCGCLLDPFPLSFFFVTLYLSCFFFLCWMNFKLSLASDWIKIRHEIVQPFTIQYIKQCQTKSSHERSSHGTQIRFTPSPFGSIRTKVVINLILLSVS